MCRTRLTRFYLFELETQPLTKHTILTGHLNKTGRSLGTGNPNRGFVRLTLSGEIKDFPFR